MTPQIPGYLLSFESIVRPASDLTFRFGYTYLDAKYDASNNFTGTPLAGLEGRQIQNQPQNVVTATATWTPQSWHCETTGKLARARLGYAGLTVPEHFITADMVTAGKPSPEPYLKGAALLDLDPKDCLVIEDSSAGASAGHAAGCKVLATLFSHTVESLSAADWIVHSLDDVSVRALGDAVEVEFTPLVQNGH